MTDPGDRATDPSDPVTDPCFVVTDPCFVVTDPGRPIRPHWSPILVTDPTLTHKVKLRSSWISIVLGVGAFCDKILGPNQMSSSCEIGTDK